MHPDWKQLATTHVVATLCGCAHFSKLTWYVSNCPGTKRKFAAPANAPLTELSLNTSHAPALPPKAQHTGKLQVPKPQLQPHSQPQAASTRLNKRHRVGTTVTRRTCDSDKGPPVQDRRQLPSAVGALPIALGNPLLSRRTAGGQLPAAHRLQPLVDASEALHSSQPFVQVAKVAQRAEEPQATLQAPHAAVAQHRVRSQAAKQSAKQDRITSRCAVRNGQTEGTAQAEVPISFTLRQVSTGDQQDNAVTLQAGARSVSDTAWRLPYNHEAYADDSTLADIAIHTAGSDASLFKASDASPMVSASIPTAEPESRQEAQKRQTGSTGDLPGAGTLLAADKGLQQQYDNLVVDLAAQQSQLPGVRHSRLWETQLQPQASGPLPQLAVEPLDTLQRHAPVLLGQEPSVSPGQTPVTGETVAQLAAALPEDPFHQQLPQHCMQPARELSHERLPQSAEGQVSKAANTNSSSSNAVEASCLQELAGSRQDNGGQPPDTGLLKASLAEWLADAVASRLWSAFQKGKAEGAVVAHETDLQQSAAPDGVSDMLGMLLTAEKAEEASAADALLGALWLCS